MGLNWFYSRTVRHADRMRKHVHKILSAQRDLLSPQAIQAVEASLADVRKVLQKNSPTKDVENQMAELEKTANKWLKPYPYGGLRENIEVFLVAIAVAMAVRTFFLQPFKIPTGSMQPTLFGITSENLKLNPEAKVPGAGRRFFEAIVKGTFYHQLVAEDDCEIVEVGPQEHFSRFINKHRIWVQYPNSKKTHTVWFTPDERFPDRAGVQPGQRYRKGEPIIKMKEVSGDHLFVDRV